jgi:hypothetical protein
MRVRVLVYYTDFHWDNYQGGSGKYFNFKILIQLEDDVKVSEFWEVVHNQLKHAVKIQRTFVQDNSPKITKAEVL